MSSGPLQAVCTVRSGSNPKPPKSKRYAAAALSASAIIQKLIAYKALRLLYPDAPLWNLAIVVDYPTRNFAEPMP
ncbi:MAG: hypothetical protein J0G97_20520, partial [Rhizobium pusense]|nr:hypothetical protein [Agrobacterium pusense]